MNLIKTFLIASLLVLCIGCGSESSATTGSDRFTVSGIIQANVNLLQQRLGTAQDSGDATAIKIAQDNLNNFKKARGITVLE